jgi:methylase of polypeptide subunit release factors
LGIFLADQKQCKVTGVDLNPKACKCAEDNISNLKLNNSIKVINYDFAVFTENYKGDKFDLIVANPPVDDKITNDVILKYANNHDLDWSSILPDIQEE